MAKKYKQPSIVSGMSVEDILSMDIEKFMKLSTSELRKVTGRLVSAGNKRIRALEKSGYSTPATRQVSKSGGIFSTKGKELNALRSEFTRAKQFMQSGTSTKTGYIKTRNIALDRMKEQGVDVRGSAREDVLRKLKEQGKTVKDVGKREFNKMVEKATQERTEKLFRAYEDLREVSPDVANRGMKYGAMKEISDMITENPEDTPDTIATRVQNELSAIYEEQMGLEHGTSGVSEFFEFE